MSSSKLRAGDWVEVRSKEEILKTLDSHGRLEGMPFMPEMLAFCGRKFRVYKRAHKTCDTVFPVRGRRVSRAVHLETRCDGSAHGGCQAGCLLFWKEAWIKPCPSENNSAGHKRTSRSAAAESAPALTENAVHDLTHTVDPSDREPVYVCQATRLPYATERLDWWDVRQYFEDYVSGNVSLWRILCGAIYVAYYHLSISGIRGGGLMQRLYDRFHHLWGGAPYPRKTGTIPAGETTPTQMLNLQPGELVRIKSHEEILRTLDSSSRNRGLYFDAEEVPYCGGTHRVLRRVEKIVNERTGKMRLMKSPCIVLEGVICQSRYSECRFFCPRSIYSYWREIWLERVGPPLSHPQGPAVAQASLKTTTCQ